MTGIVSALSNPVIAGLVVAILQAFIGWLNGQAAKTQGTAEAAATGEPGKAQMLAIDIAFGDRKFSIDTPDVLAVLFSIFIFWAVGTKALDGNSALAAFTVVATGTGVKELLEKSKAMKT